MQGDLPGPRSAALLARQERRESNARAYARHFPIAVAEASGSFIRDVDGNVFIDFLTGAGVLSLGHNHPELVAVATEQLGRSSPTGWTCPTPAKDAFTEAQLSMLPGRMRDRMKMHFCGPTGANAVDAAIKLCKTATGRGDVVSFQGGFHGSSHAAMALTGNVGQKRPIANGMPGVRFFPFSYCCRCPLALRPRHLRDQLRRLAGARAARPERRPRAAGRGDHGDGAGRGRRDPGRPASSCGGCAS